MTQIDKSYDVVIVGAGPAGLAAARTTSRLGFSTAVIDRLSAPGDASPTCTGLSIAEPGFVTGQPMLGGLFFPQVDLLLPEELIISRHALQSCVSPGGFRVEKQQASEHAVSALIDVPGLLKLLAGQATRAGAEMHYDTEAAGLLWQGDQVVGVRTPAGDIRAGVVIAAEGLSQRLCEEAGLCETGSKSEGYALVVAEELEAPEASSQHVGRLITFGRRYTSAPAGFGALFISQPGHAIMSFTIPIDQSDCGLADSAWHYLAEYAQDPRICGLLGRGRVVRRWSSFVPLHAAPSCTVRQGFMGIGDAITPAGHLGTMAAIHVGRQAGLIVAEALDGGDATAEALMPFDQFYQAAVLPVLNSEWHAVRELLAMSDDELDRLCRLLDAFSLPMPFFEAMPASGSAGSVAWLTRQFALAPEDAELLRRTHGTASADEARVLSFNNIYVDSLAPEEVAA